MPLVTLVDFERSGLTVSSDMFGANAVFSETDDGVPRSGYVSSAEALGVQNIRFGGGQADPNQRSQGADDTPPQDGMDAINVVTMFDGQLRPELVNFLEWCADQAEQGEAITTTLVIPTKHLSPEDYEGFAEDIEVFVETVMRDYGELISAFQLGNEYWEIGETAYGQNASLAAEAIANGLQAAGIPETEQPDILIQMATAGNAGSEFPSVEGVADFNERNKAANEAIIAQLSEEARTAIDGVTEHYYYNKGFIEFLPTEYAVNNINRDYAVWSEALGDDLDLVITEWNVKTSAPDQFGLVSASTVIEQFANMIEIGADGAHVWALDYHSSTALTLRSDDGARLDENDRLINSPSGAVFDLMSENLVGKELVFSTFEGSIEGVEFVSYASDTEMVTYVTSRSLDPVDLTLDLASALGVSGPVEAVQVEIDTSTSNGRQWENGKRADSVEIDGQAYFYNEHDVDVVLTDMVFANPSEITLSLDPFEAVQIKVDLMSSNITTQTNLNAVAITAVSPVYVGTSADDLIILSNLVTLVDGGTGQDTLTIGALRSQVDLSLEDDGTFTFDVPGLREELSVENVERIEFVDGNIALDLDGAAGQAYRLYEASFDRTPDTAGLTFWISQLDAGLSLEDAAQSFIDSLEFGETYGTSETVSDFDFLTLLYNNVLDRDPDQAGFDFWSMQQDNGMSRADILVHFSESEENKDNVLPTISDGIWYG